MAKIGGLLIVSLSKVGQQSEEAEAKKNQHESRVWTRIYPVDSHTQPHRVGRLTRKFVISNSRTCSSSGYEIPQLRSEHTYTHIYTYGSSAA